MANRTHLSLVGALAALLLPSACKKSGPPDPVLGRLAPAAFPFALHSSDVDGAGVFIGHNLYYQLDQATPTLEMAALPIAVAALPDRLVVVFPAADRDGFDLAQGGLDLPWTRQPLNDLARKDLGAVDAIASNDGAALIVFRDRRDGTLTLHRFKPGSAVQTEVIPRPAGTRRAGWRDRCPDVTLGMSRAGDLDVLFQQVDPVYRLMRARKAASTGAWTVDEVTNVAGPLAAAVPQGQFFEVGCKSAIAYDEDDTPLVLTLGRVIPSTTGDVVGGTPTPGGLPVGTLGSPPPTNFEGFYVGGDGRWRQARGQWAFLPTQTGGSSGVFDLETHPEGFVLAAPFVDFHNYNSDDGATLRLPVVSFDRPAPALQPVSKDYGLHWPHIEFSAAGIGNVTKITVDPCGNLAAHGASREALPTAELELAVGGAFCPLAPSAPVRGVSTFNQVEALPVWAHGRRPYEVAMCLLGKDSTLTVCEGGTLVAAGTAWPEDDLPTLVSSVPADGATDVAADLKTVTLTLSRALRAGETVALEVDSLQLLGVSNGSMTGPHDASLTLPMPADVRPGTGYRASAAIRSDDGSRSAHYLTKKPPVIAFHIAGAPTAPDPRYVPEALMCPGVVASDGTCTDPSRPDPDAGGAVSLWLADDVQYPDGAPVLQDAAGATVASHVVAGFNFGAPGSLSWDVPLKPGASYVVAYPPGQVNTYGAPYAPVDLKRAFVTGP
jgi:hypothetical protein